MKLPVVRQRSPMIFADSKALLTTEDREQVVDFTRELEDALRDLNDSVAKSQALSAKADELSDVLSKRGFFRSFGASFSGATDKELATLVQRLGANLGVTQNVVRVLLRVMTQKNRVLHAFNETLVNKIALLQTDTNTLDGNQKLVVRQFLAELQQQVSDQIEHTKRVDSHELQLIDHGQWREDKDELDREVGAYLEYLRDENAKAFSQLSDLKRQSDDLRLGLTGLQNLHVEAHQRILSLEGCVEQQQELLREAENIALATGRRVGELEAQAAALASESHALAQRAVAAEERLAQDGQAIAVLQVRESEMSNRVVALEGRLEALERSERLSRSTRARLLHAAPAAAAALLGVTALYLTMMG
ncbi:MAG: hypothetical protein ACN6OP_19685 [Pseudomonadales bacterium]|uniref:hypothetical protein n=1 Tax=Stenotrophomonas indicatrix TaxID=2045451 RepID=UPI0020058305|nr:hypothetical protein [Stenotrophomonas indicatrix]MCK6232808.1 hypothetical protein [Stenotrophomonas indicatrix]MCK6233026.1 hypothetical protein [Stenotrophomonas indicatrix]